VPVSSPPPSPSTQRARPLLGTFVSIRVDGLPDSDAHHAIETGFSEIARIHRLMSFHEPASDVSRLNRDAFAGPVRVAADTYEVMRRAVEMADASKGVFDVTIAAALVAWGFLPTPDATPPDPAASWRDIELIPPDRVRFHRRLWIDFGGIAKGYAVDRAMERMAVVPEAQCCVNAGGDLRLQGPRSERILLRVTGTTGAQVPVIELENGSLASSSGRDSARRVAGRGAVGPHLDPAGRRPTGLQSFVSVAADKCVVADALTKIVLARGARSAGLLRRFGATAYLHTARSGWRILGAGH